MAGEWWRQVQPITLMVPPRAADTRQQSRKGGDIQCLGAKATVADWQPREGEGECESAATKDATT